MATEFVSREFHDAVVGGARAEAERFAAVVAAAGALLHKIDNMTSEQFSRGEERPEREALRAALRAA